MFSTVMEIKQEYANGGTQTFLHNTVSKKNVNNILETGSNYVRINNSTIADWEKKISQNNTNEEGGVMCVVVVGELRAKARKLWSLLVMVWNMNCLPKAHV